VRLPLAGAQPLDGVPAGAARALLHGRRVLVVDADTQALHALRALLELEGAIVVTAGSAEDALAVAARRQPDIVLTELSLPDASGQDLRQRLHALPGAATLPVIAVDGLAPAATGAAAEGGFSALLSKPLTLDKLVQALRDAP
jgi:CheY-like chemotaxis protein